MCWPCRALRLWTACFWEWDGTPSLSAPMGNCSCWAAEAIAPARTPRGASMTCSGGRPGVVPPEPGDRPLVCPGLHAP